MTLFWKFKKEYTPLFLDEQREIVVDTQKEYNIILSPSLYWVKRVTLPLKNANEVKKIVQTLFEDILPSGSYSYDVVKEEDTFLIFAYEDEQIKELVIKKGLSLSKLNAVTFAQLALPKSDKVYKVSATQALTFKEDIALLLPLEWFHRYEALRESDFLTTKHRVMLNQFSHTIDAKILYKLTIILGLFLVLLVFEYATLSKQKEEIVAQKEKLFSKYNLKPTMMQNRAIVQKYEKIDTEAKKLREYLYMSLNLPLKKGESIEKVAYKKHLLELSFKGVTKERQRSLFSWFYKHKISLNIKEKAKTIVVEIKL
jgi:hypothetical protein